MSELTHHPFDTRDKEPFPMADLATSALAPPTAIAWDRWIALAVWVMTAILAYRAGQPIPQPPPVDPKPAVIVLTTAPQASIATHP